MGGGVPSAALARRVGRENGGSSGGGDADGDRSDAPVGLTPTPQLPAGRPGRTQVTGGASANGRGARDAPRLARARVDGGLRASAWAACAARVRRWVRIWSTTDA